jgi:nucleoside-diphosphate-sugar epimerase
MIFHNSFPLKPKRVIILGAGGFVGSYIEKKCIEQNLDHLSFTRNQLDLLDPLSSDKLKKMILPEDVVILLATLTPRYGRGIDILFKNITICKNVIEGILKKEISQFIYLSSDAVYPFQLDPITIHTPAVINDLYGCMHRTREIMLASSLEIPLAIIRSTLVYGFGDPHDSYGPNRMIRTAMSESKINLFGKGEETRDHVYIEDLSNIIFEILLRKGQGIVNAVSGSSISYCQLAELIANKIANVNIYSSDRKNEITHRIFDTKIEDELFSSIKKTNISDGISLYIEKIEETSCAT